MVWTEDLEQQPALAEWHHSLCQHHTLFCTCCWGGLRIGGFLFSAALQFADSQMYHTVFFFGKRLSHHLVADFAFATDMNSHPLRPLSHQCTNTYTVASAAPREYIHMRTMQFFADPSENPGPCITGWGTSFLHSFFHSHNAEIEQCICAYGAVLLADYVLFTCTYRYA
jgi:hypothetical protein